jgi:hypothetical protein
MKAGLNVEEIINKINSRFKNPLKVTTKISLIYKQDKFINNLNFKNSRAVFFNF